jgi:hypothetical protein
MTHKHRHRPVGSIPARDTTEDQPLALRKPEVAELAHENCVDRLQVRDIVERRNFKPTRPEEVAEKDSPAARRSNQADSVGSVSQRHGKPVALALVDLGHHPPPLAATKS